MAGFGAVISEVGAVDDGRRQHPGADQGADHGHRRREQQGRFRLRPSPSGVILMALVYLVNFVLTHRSSRGLKPSEQAVENLDPIVEARDLSVEYWAARRCWTYLCCRCIPNEVPGSHRAERLGQDDAAALPGPAAPAGHRARWPTGGYLSPGRTTSCGSGAGWRWSSRSRCCSTARSGTT